jgi:hypothetical protein
MRTVLFSATALVTGFVLSAAAQDAAKQPSGCGPSAMSTKTSQGMTQSGFTNPQEIPKAVVIHAIDPDGHPVLMLIAPAD